MGKQEIAAMGNVRYGDPESQAAHERRMAEAQQDLQSMHGKVDLVAEVRGQETPEEFSPVGGGLDENMPMGGVASEVGETPRAESLENELKPEKGYWEKIAAYAEERTPGSMMSEEEKTEQAVESEERKGLLARVKDKLRGRKGFRRVMVRALAGMVSVLALSGIMAQVADAANVEKIKGRNPRVEYDAGEVGDQISLTEAEQGLMDQINQSEVEEDASDGIELGSFEELRARGQKYYEDINFMAMEGSYIGDNGLRVNLAEAVLPVNPDVDPNSPEAKNFKKSKGNYGYSREALYDIQDEDERKRVVIDDMKLDLAKDPLYLATKLATSPQILQACGVDEISVRNF